MKQIPLLVVLGGILFPGSMHAVTVLYHNGSIITHPGLGPDWADVSMASSDANSAGVNANSSVNRGRADNFHVAPGGWFVDSVAFLAYDAGAPGGIPRWNGFSIQIWSGDLAAGTATLMGVAASYQVEPAGTNRVFHSSDGTTLSDASRPVHRISGGFDGLFLPGGSYWTSVAIQAAPGASAWTPMVMEPNPADLNFPTTVAGDSLLFSNGSWDTFVNVGGITTEVAFQVSGTAAEPGAIPEPSSTLATMALLTAGLFLRGQRRPAKRK